MDALKNVISNATSGNNNNNNNNNNQDGNNNQGSSGGGLLDKVNSLAGGGAQGEKNEDLLDKGVDAFQQYVLKEGDQSNESAIEQAKDEQISDFIRSGYKKATGKDIPIADK